MGLLGKIGDALLGGIPNMVSGVIGAGAGLLQAKQERKFNAEQAELNRQFQTGEREAAQDWNLEMWNKQNEYNTPKAQLERAMAAGINPNAAVQGISGSSNAGSVQGSSGQSGSQASAPGSVAGSLMDTITGTTQDMFTNYQAIQEAESKRLANARYNEITDTTLKDMEATIDLKVEQKDYTKQQGRQIKEMLPLLKGKTVAEINEIKKSAELITKQILTEQAKFDNIEASTENIEANTTLTNEDIKKRKEEVWYEQWKNWFRDVLGVDVDTAFLNNFLTVGGKALNQIGLGIEGVIQKIEEMMAPGDGEGYGSGPGPFKGLGQRYLDWLMPGELQKFSKGWHGKYGERLRNYMSDIKKHYSKYGNSSPSHF